MVGFAPGVQIQVEYAAPSTTVASQLPVYCFGPAADVFPYVMGSLANQGRLGTYNPNASESIGSQLWNAYAYPERRLGGIVDREGVEVYVQNGLFRYFRDLTHQIEKVNRNTLTLPAYVLKTGNGHIASSVVPSRQVQVGDPVQVRATLAGNVPYVLNTYITELVGLPVAATVGLPTVGAANAAAKNDATAIATAIAGDNPANTDIDLTVDASSYNGAKAARLIETYTVEALTTTADNSVTGATFKVTSADNKDNVAVGTLDGSGYLALGSRGGRVQFASGGVGTNINAGDLWQIQVGAVYVRPTVTDNDTFNGPEDVTYIIEVIEGGTFAQAPRIRVSSVNGNDQSGPHAVTLASGSNSAAIAIGNYGLTITFAMPNGLYTGDRWSIACTAQKAGKLSNISLAHSLSDDIAVDDPSLDIEVDFFVRRTVAIPKYNGVTEQWMARENDVLVVAGVSMKFSDITNNVGAEIACPLIARSLSDTFDCQIYASYRVWHPQSNSLMQLSASDSIADTIPGPSTKDNPLKYALTFARAEAAGPAIYYFVVGDPSVQANWEKALQVVDQSRSVYGLVPVTQDLDILLLVQAHCVSRSTPLLKLHRVCWVSPSVSTIQAISGDVSTLTATITDDPDQAGNNFTLVEFTAGNIDLLEAGVRTGDVLRYNFGLDDNGNPTYEEGVIDIVVNSDTLKLRNSLAVAEPIARQVEIVRHLEGEDLADAMEAAVLPFGGFATVMAPSYYVGNTEVPGYVMAAAMAARRSAYLPHQPMTNTETSGISGLVWEPKFTAEQLNSLAVAGYFLFKQDPATSVITVRHAVTAGDFSNILTREESIRANVHSLVFLTDDQLKPIYGKVNANEATVQRVKTEILSLENSIIAQGIDSIYGPQVVRMDPSNTRVSELSEDTILVNLLVEVPKVANLIDVYMFVS